METIVKPTESDKVKAVIEEMIHLARTHGVMNETDTMPEDVKKLYTAIADNDHRYLINTMVNQAITLETVELAKLAFTKFFQLAEQGLERISVHFTKDTVHFFAQVTNVEAEFALYDKVREIKGYFKDSLAKLDLIVTLVEFGYEDPDGYHLLLPTPEQKPQTNAETGATF